MPYLRGGRTHAYNRRELAAGRLAVSPVNDGSLLKFPHRKGKTDAYPGPVLHGHYLVVGWRPMEIVALGLIVLSFGSAFANFVGALGSHHARISNGYERIYWWIGAVSLAVLITTLRWLLRRRYRKFVVFDRLHGLVHIPYFFGSRMARVRFEDLNACIVEMPTGTMFLETETVLYFVRPGWDLIRDGYPPRRYLTAVARGLADKPTVEAKWLVMVSFMTEPPPPMPTERERYLESHKKGRRHKYLVEPHCLENLHWIVDSSYGGDWKRYIKDIHIEYSRFDPTKLGTTPNWVREPDGRWRRVREGEVVPTHGVVPVGEAD